MEKIFNDIKSAYENNWARFFGYFKVEYVTAKGTYDVVFLYHDDFGRWTFNVSKGLAYPYIYLSDWISDGRELTDSNILEVANEIKSLDIYLDI